jgi:hypothetical protein
MTSCPQPRERAHTHTRASARVPTSPTTTLPSAAPQQRRRRQRRRSRQRGPLANPSLLALYLRERGGSESERERDRDRQERKRVRSDERKRNCSSPKRNGFIYCTIYCTIGVNGLRPYKSLPHQLITHKVILQYCTIYCTIHIVQYILYNRLYNTRAVPPPIPLEGVGGPKGSTHPHPPSRAPRDNRRASGSTRYPRRVPRKKGLGSEYVAIGREMSFTPRGK